MLILAADASLPVLSVALLEDAAIRGAVALEGRSSRNEKLLPAIDWLLAETGAGRGEIGLFAVTRGPGSFTGVRIGLATIQGLALALGKPVCAMSTHEAIAAGEAGEGTTLVVDDAGRGEFYVSSFAARRETAPPRLVSDAEREELARVASRVIRVPEFLETGNVAIGCARRARELAARGDDARYRDVTPIYVRLAEAEIKLAQKTG